MSNTLKLSNLTNKTPFFLPDNELYSGTVADFSGSDPIIYREPLQTEQYDSLSLNAPNFVGSFNQGDFVYFFFRETAVEFINCGKVGRPLCFIPTTTILFTREKEIILTSF